MDRQCEQCGVIHDEAWMMFYNSGHKRHWFCWECWKKSQGEATGFETQCRRKKIQEKEK